MMKEKILLDYFNGNATTDTLLDGLADTLVNEGQIDHFKIESIDSEGEFIVRPEHLVKLSNEAINGRLRKENLGLISFILIASDFFTWDTGTDDGEKVSRVLFDWDNPSINYPLTTENVKLWKVYLETGTYNLSK